jgi:uncharacterized membrane protein YphA (DoxX/SURF4 family)
MEFATNTQIFIACCCRILLGILFFFQGYEKLFRFKVKGVAAVYNELLQKTGLPPRIISICILFNSIIEFIGGLFLIGGIFTTLTLYMLGINMVAVAFFFSLIRPMWDLQYFFPRFVLLMFLLLLPETWQILSIDYMLTKIIH